MWNTDPNDHLYNNMLGSHLAREMGDTTSQSHHVGLETLKILMIIMLIVMILIIMMIVMILMIIMITMILMISGRVRLKSLKIIGAL